ncbi:unnamed protein product [Penicillium salamii]|nr:unnamed protein product [Penicillium salamii]CAG8416364.1 unnamed protein product [Penicillium salamii]
MSSREIHVAVLDTDIPCYHVYAKRGLYSSQFNSLLAAAAGRINATGSELPRSPLSVHVTAFDIVGGSYPHAATLRASPWSAVEKHSPGSHGPIDAILVTGATAAVYDKLHWIPGLRSFIQRVYTDYPLVKIFGSCFGHQLIGEVLLASDLSYTSKKSSFKISVEAAPQGHEIGMFPITLNPSFVSRFPPLARFAQEPFNIQLIHGDSVISSPDAPGPEEATGDMLPGSWLSVGSSLKCPIQGLYQPGRVLTLQGHFEFDAFATAELCYKFAGQFGWSQEVLDTHLERIRRSVRPNREDEDDSKVTAEAVLCETCRRRKVKCSGDKPCRACIKHNWECTFGHSGRRRYSEAQVKHLLDKIRIYEEQSNPQVSGGSSTVLNSPAAEFETPASPSSTRPSATAANKEAHQLLPDGISYAGNDAAISPATDLTSGPAFESQVRSLLHRSHPNETFYGPDSTPQDISEQIPEWTSVRELVSENSDVTFPSLEESQHLLELFLFYLGVSQHFFDPRSFSDELMLLFQTAESRKKQMRSPWFTEYLLVMAMAKLINVRHPTSQPPGSDLFTEALKRLPPLHQMGGESAIMVEILTLITTYLQWSDHKHDAYLYAGVALRLAIALGCNLRETEQSCLPSQSAHRLRLWWTVYMLDRRLSSGLGLAAGADERQLCIELPRQAAGFQSPVALTINVRIARVTDDIMSTLYGNKSITQLELVHKIKHSLQELHDTARSFPTPLVLDFGKPLQWATRTGASLYLMLFQAIILCTRPILLQRARLVAENKEPQTLDQIPEVLNRLCDTCNEAATRSLAILAVLRRQQTIPRYGFFDLDATFSAAFVLVMVGFSDKSQTQPPPALYQAFEVLQFLSQAGNLAAGRRLHDITQSCLHVWPDNVLISDYLPTDSILRDQHQKDPLQKDSQDPFVLSSEPSSSTALHTGWGNHRDEARLLEPLADINIPDAMFDMQGEWDLDLSDEAEGIYSSFHHPTLPLTGVDYIDWLEIEKVIGAP